MYAVESAVSAMLAVCRHDNNEVSHKVFAVEWGHHQQGDAMNWREMTPRERRIEKLKDYGLAVAISLSLAWVLVERLSK